MKTRPAKPMIPNEIGELAKQRVCADLLERGFRVYRAVGLPPDADFIIMPGKLAVKVKAGRKLKNGNIYTHPTNADFDVLAKVVTDEIVYEPEV